MMTYGVILTSPCWRACLSTPSSTPTPLSPPSAPLSLPLVSRPPFRVGPFRVQLAGSITPGFYVAGPEHHGARKHTSVPDWAVT